MRRRRLARLAALDTSAAAAAPSRLSPGGGIQTPSPGASSPLLGSPPVLVAPSSPAAPPERVQDEMEVDEPCGAAQSEDKEPDKSSLSMQADVDSGFENMEVEEAEKQPQETRRRRVTIIINNVQSWKWQNFFTFIKKCSLSSSPGSLAICL